MKYLKSFMVLFLVLVSTINLYSRMPNEYENYCLQVIGSIEKALKPKIPKDYQVVQTHISPIGQIFNQQHLIRDCIIEKKEWNGIFVAYVFVYPINNNNSTKLSKFNILDESIGFSEHKFQVGILCADQNLESLIKEAILEIRFENIKLFEY
ncbi:MAG: hypothetical protein BWY26_01249 [Elusimicrobia bacterium ADurb.Bin231]|nr:MAG: hypothetical protein BWY26_01249 [Elusimicrobia bacterium ADurb.Bin231]